MNNKQFFGYIVEKTENRTVLDSLETYENQIPKCIVQLIDFDLLFQIKQDTTTFHNFKIGDWVLSSGNCHSSGGVKVQPPFDNLDKALNFARENLGVNIFLEPPTFNMKIKEKESNSMKE